jgi:hypothetical protein
VGPVRVEQDLAVQVDAADLGVDEPLRFGEPHGALPTLFAATQDLPGNSYVGPDGPGGIKGHPKLGRPSRAARHGGNAAELWRATAALTGLPD